MKRLLSRLIPLIPAALLGAPSALAQTSGAFFQTEPATGITAAAQGSLGQNVTTILNYALGFLGLVAVGFIIYGGVLMVTSAGNEEGVGKAKKIITYAAIGIVLIMLSYTIVTFVTSALG